MNPLPHRRAELVRQGFITAAKLVPGTPQKNNHHLQLDTRSTLTRIGQPLSSILAATS
jgi:hypothetical protein